MEYTSQFTAQHISADQFQKKWLDVWSREIAEDKCIPNALLDLLTEIFYAIEDYDGDPEARPENGLDQEELRKAIHQLLKEFEQMT